MIDTPTDNSKLTSHGEFAGKIPVDLSLSKLLIYGISLGVGAEAVVVANAMSQPKTIFRIASPLVHTDPSVFNEILRASFTGMLSLDGGLYSEPLMMLRLFIAWKSLSTAPMFERQTFIENCGIAHVRLNHFITSSHHLLHSVNDVLDKNAPVLSFNNMITNWNETTINKLRLILLWSLEFNLLCTADKPAPAKPNVISFPKFVDRDSFLVEFPAPYDNIHWNSGNSKYIYLLPVHLPVLTETPVLLQSFFNVVSNLTPATRHVVLVVRHNSTTKDNNRILKSKSGKSSKKAIKCEYSSSDVFVVLVVMKVCDCWSEEESQGDQSRGSSLLRSIVDNIATASGSCDGLAIRRIDCNSSEIALFAFGVNTETQVEVVSQVNFMANLQFGWII
jgi:hypothetical protein